MEMKTVSSKCLNHVTANFFAKTFLHPSSSVILLCAVPFRLLIQNPLQRLGATGAGEVNLISYGEPDVTYIAYF